MKKHKSLLILLSVLLVLVVAYVAVSKLNKKSENEQSEKTEVKVDTLTDIISIQYTNGTDTMEFVKEEDSWYNAADKTFPLQQSSVETVVNTFSNLSANRELKDADAPADYGLEEPQYTITLKDADGKEQKVYIGNTAGEDYYMTLDQKEKIYTVGYEVVNALNFDLDSMLQREAFPSIGSDEIQKVTVVKDGVTTEYDASNEEQSEDITAISGGLGAAYFTDCADYSVSEEELSQYGLDEAHRTTVTVVYAGEDDKEETFVLYVGARDETDAYNYVQMEGSQMVNTMTKEVVNNILNIEE